MVSGGVPEAHFNGGSTKQYITESVRNGWTFSASLRMAPMVGICWPLLHSDIHTSGDSMALRIPAQYNPSRSLRGYFKVMDELLVPSLMCVGKASSALKTASCVTFSRWVISPIQIYARGRNAPVELLLTQGVYRLSQVTSSP